jgi:hypothetical protein
MSDLMIDTSSPARDLVFQNGDFVIVRGPAARKQRIDIALRHIQGEWYYDANAGTDYFGKILGKSRDLTRRAELRRRILGVPGVVSVQSMQLQLDPKTRRMSGTIEALDITGVPLDVDVEGI